MPKGSQQIFQHFARRCQELGVSAWWCSADGQLQTGNADAPPWVERIARDELNRGSRSTPEVMPGRRAAAFVRRHGAQRLGAAVVCYPAHSPELEQTLRWMFEDLCAIAHHDVTLQQFSDTLAQTCEESNLLFRLARMMNSDTTPSRLMAKVCEQLQEVLPFGWIAMKFRDDGVEVGDLAGRTLLSGHVPIVPAEFDRLAMAVIHGWSGDERARLLEPARSEFASAAGSEIIAEPIAHDDKVIGALLAGNKANGDPDVTSGELQFMDAAADFLGMFHENVARFAEQRATFMGTMHALVAAIDAKDPYTSGHSERVAILCSTMASAMKLGEADVEHYRVAGLLHDVGKIGVPDYILTKVGGLDDAELGQIRRHPEIGHNILKDIPALGPALPGVLYHHEQWDGGGYPVGLAGDNIPLIARVIAIADTFDAMSSHRSYRQAMPRDEALAELTRYAGAQFDPELVPVFVKLNFVEFDRRLRGLKQSRAA
jgi:HD-GYP domain-containing protein (c-di-GMP phosphodiesterase class II)